MSDESLTWDRVDDEDEIDVEETLSNLEELKAQFAREEAAAKPEAYDVELVSFDRSRKFALIDKIREITGLGFSEANDFVEISPFKAIKRNITPEQTRQISNMISEAGGTVKITKYDKLAELEAQAAEAARYDVELVSYQPEHKIAVIKEIRRITELGLKEVKELVEGVLPQPFKRNIRLNEAHWISLYINKAGGKAAVKKVE
jgi:ribosomal protein L7/L12